MPGVRHPGIVFKFHKITKMKKRSHILLCVLMLASVLANAVHADSYRIVRLSKSPISIGGVKLTEQATFDGSKKIEWTDDKQVMEVVNTTTGKHYTARRRVSPQNGRTIKDFIVRTAYGSTRDSDDDASLILATSPVGPEFPERRAALVIGNSNYEEMARLRNAQGDAAAVADELATMGFDVMQLYEADERSMKNALRRFSKLARGYDFVMFYFAGHGVQEDGFNYLLPVEARLEFKSELRNCLSADDVVQHLDAMPAAGRLVVLDACRNARKSWARSADEGLARMEAGEGTVILFSTQSGKTALDGDGEHSPFATALLANITKPDTDFTHAINNVVRDTYFATEKQQYPLLVGSLLNDFAFNGGRVSATPEGKDNSADSEIHEWVEKGNKAYDEEQYAEALKWYEKAAAQGDISAQTKLGYMYIEGTGVTPDYAEAAKWFHKSAEQGDAGAQCILGAMYANGEGVAQNYSLAAQLYQKAAEQGLAPAQYSLGVLYTNGLGVSQNYAEAVKWYQTAAEQSFAPAQCNFGAMYVKGQGVSQNYTEAVKWFREAAKQGYAEAQHNLGVMYADGQGVSQDYTEAVKWYQIAAEQSFAPAQCNLGIMYYDGIGVEQNFSLAAQWYRRAAEQGFAQAQYNLGVMYYYGEGVTQNFSLAEQWYRKAAEQGDASAQFNLGIMCYNGEGVTKDSNEARKWFRLAAAQGHSGAQEILVKYWE